MKYTIESMVKQESAEGNFHFFDFAPLFASETREIFRITRKLTSVKLMNYTNCSC